MALAAHEIESRVRTAGAALQQGRPVEARQHLEALTQAGLNNIQVWLMLATACRDLGDFVEGERAADAVLAIDPSVARAHIIKGDCCAATGRNADAIREYKFAASLAAGQDVPPGLAVELQRAQAAADAIGSQTAEAMDAKLASAGLAHGTRSPRFQESIDLMLGRKDIYFQQPTGYYFPGLAQRQYFDPAEFTWSGEIEAATEVIRDELRGVLADMAGFKPYMHSGLHRPSNTNHALIDNKEWSTLFFVENGARDEAVIARCPKTWEAVQPALAWIERGSPTVMFSLLRPGARILPHTGMLNTRLTCHLPLIVPEGCGFRVGNEVRQWEEGKLLIFDDSIEHEAWNDSAEDRVVLIFDTWRPDITASEREEIAVLIQALQ